MDTQTEPQAARPDAGRRHHNSAAYEIFILFLTVFSLITMVWRLVQLRDVSTNAVLFRVDFLICMVFLTDFFILLQRAPRKGRYFFSEGGWLDLLGSIPAVRGVPGTAFLRLARVSRAGKIIRHLKDQDPAAVLRDTRRKPAQTVLLTLLMTAIVLITITSLAILVVERGAPGANIITGPDAFWWAMVTVTTVGYGDHTPVTFAGRVMAMGLMTLGIGIFAGLTTFLAARVVALQGEDNEDTAALIREENAKIRAELAELRRLLERQDGKGKSED